MEGHMYRSGVRHAANARIDQQFACCVAHCPHHVNGLANSASLRQHAHLVGNLRSRLQERRVEYAVVRGAVAGQLPREVDHVRAQPGKCR
eukprot:8896238-Pyramimonas_sp.AAC.1